MYQQDNTIKYENGNPLEQSDFIKLKNIFKETILRNPNFSFNKNNKEYDLSKTYTPNHACIWNSINNIGRPCTIIQKDNELALVSFNNSLN